MCPQRSVIPHSPYTRPSVMIALLLALTLSGCVASRVIMYDGTEVPANKQAIIRAEQEEPTDGFLGIAGVDGRSTVPFGKLAFRVPTEVAVLPGKHTIVLVINYPFSHAVTKVWLVAEAGEVYVAKTRSEWDRVAIWMENERTGLPTGGISGSEDEPKEDACREGKCDKPISDTASRRLN